MLTLKKAILICLLSTNIISFGNGFTYSINGLNRFIILEFPEKSKHILYKKTINWSKEHFDGYDKTNCYEILNEKVRFQVFIRPKLKAKIQISIKDFKVKFELVSLMNKTRIASNDGYTYIDYRKVDIGPNKDHFNGKKIKSKYKEKYQTIVNALNKLKNNFIGYVTTNYRERENW